MNKIYSESAKKRKNPYGMLHFKVTVLETIPL